MNTWARGIVSRESLQVLFLAMECAWLAGLLLVIDGIMGRTGRAGLAWLCAGYLPAYALARWAEYRPVPGKIRRTALLAAGAAFLVLQVWFLSGPAEEWTGLRFFARPETIAIIVGGGFIWARGWFLAGRQVESTGLINGFQWGLGILIITVLSASLVELNPDPIISVTAAFFVIGLAGIAWARRRETVEESGAAYNKPWAWAMPTAVAFVLLLGLAGFTFIDRGLLEILFRPLFSLWEAFLRLLDYLIGLLPEPGPMDIKGLPPSPPPPEANWLVTLWKRPGWLKTLGAVMFYPCFGAMILGTLFRILEDLLRFLRKRMGGGEAFTVERLEYGFFSDLKIVLLALWRLPFRLAVRLAELLRFKSPGLSEADLIRRRYSRLLKWGASLGAAGDWMRLPRNMRPGWGLSSPSKPGLISAI